MQRILPLIILLSTYMISANAEIIPDDDVDENELERIVVDVVDAAIADAPEDEMVVVYLAVPPVPFPDFGNVAAAAHDDFEAPAAPTRRRARAHRDDFAPERRRRLEPEEVPLAQPALMQVMLNAVLAHRLAAQAPVTLEMMNSRLN